MRPRFRQFIFEDYWFDKAERTLELHYSFDQTTHFSEIFHFDFEFAPYTPELLDRACQILFFIAGVSYYKAYLAPEIVAKKGAIDSVIADFLSKTYQRGLGEFFYLNHIDPNTSIAFPQTNPLLSPAPINNSGEGLLVGIGGGKDSLVSVELLRHRVDNLATWSVNHRPQLTPLVERIGLQHYWVERTWDTSLLEHNSRGALNGHIPISAIFAAVGNVVAILSGRRDVIVSNEQSANEPTLYTQGVAINHQYSKSEEFEADFQSLITHTLGNNVRYYSFLRPLSEVHIAEIFSRIGFSQYKDVFSSCNRAFVHTSNHIFWDGTCAKCAFFFLAMTSFTSRAELEAVFKGKNLLLTPSLRRTYRNLLGISGDKPLDCIGEIKESRAAMRMAQAIYPELSSLYSFDIPAGYDYRALGSNHMPKEMSTLLKDGLSQMDFAQCDALSE